MSGLGDWSFFDSLKSIRESERRFTDLLISSEKLNVK